MTFAQSVQKFVFWSANYEYDFIDRVWGKNTNMGNHLKGKFNAMYETYGPMGVINAFFFQLDTTNKKLLLDYVEKNYNGEPKTL